MTRLQFKRFPMVAFLPFFLAACGGQGLESDDAGTVHSQPDAGPILIDVDAGAPEPDPEVMGPIMVGGERPVEVFVPSSYDGSTAMPLLLFLHGYGFTGAYYESVLNLTEHAQARGFFYAVPEGLVDSNNSPYWNASPACCDFYQTRVDDVAYLRSVIEETAAVLNLDSKRVFLIGHSNGGFMSYRLACEEASWVAAFVSMAGAYPGDDLCSPSEPVAALQIHGTADGTILYQGGALAPGFDYPGAQSSITSWAELAGCSTTGEVAASMLDLDAESAGADTTVTTYADGCAAGGFAELWSVQGAGHIIAPTPTFMSAALDFLYAHPKP